LRWGVASERENRLRTAAVTYFPMFIAALSLVTAMYNGYLNSKFLAFIQRNVSHAVMAARNEADTAFMRYVSLATYLANLHPDAREPYTQLSAELEKILSDAPQIAPGELNKRFEKTDPMFARMNDDCVGVAKL
jgi:hypothetical protein